MSATRNLSDQSAQNSAAPQVRVLMLVLCRRYPASPRREPATSPKLDAGRLIGSPYHLLLHTRARPRELRRNATESIQVRMLLEWLLICFLSRLNSGLDDSSLLLPNHATYSIPEERRSRRSPPTS